MNWVLQVKNFYQKRKSQRSVAVTVIADQIPLYGASLGSSAGPVPLKLNFVIRSRANVLGNLVKPKFYKEIDCSVTCDPKKLNVPISLNNCTYDWYWSKAMKNSIVFFFLIIYCLNCFLVLFVGEKWRDSSAVNFWDMGRGARNAVLYFLAAQMPEEWKTGWIPL